MPKIVAKIKTGGAAADVTGRVRFQPTAAERRRSRPASEQGDPAERRRGADRAGDADRRRRTAPAAAAGGGGRRRRQRPRRRRRLRLGAHSPKCLPAQFRNFRRTITTPQQTIQQIVDPPQTNIKSSSYTIARRRPVEAAASALVTPSLVSSGRFLSPTGGNEALVADRTPAGRS